MFEEHYGSVYMREDLVFWQNESRVEPKDYSYHRTIFKKPEEGIELRREDAEPIYDRHLNMALSEA